MSLEEWRGVGVAGLEAARWQPSGTIRHGGSHALAFRGPAIELLLSTRLFDSREAQSLIRLAADRANATGRRPATHGGVGQATATQVRQPARRALGNVSGGAERSRDCGPRSGEMGTKWDHSPRRVLRSRLSGPR